MLWGHWFLGNFLEDWFSDGVLDIRLALDFQRSPGAIVHGQFILVLHSLPAKEAFVNFL
jgi:hypothetical protein